MQKKTIFKRIYIEITNICNLSCSFCPESGRASEFMPVERFEEVLKKLQGYGQYVYLHIKGEPMLHPDFAQIMALCHSYNLKVNLTTNGTLIRKYQETFLNFEALRQVSVSLQSQENLADESGFRTYMNDVLDLVKQGASETDIIFELRLWNYDGMVSGIKEGKNLTALTMIMDQLEVPLEVIEAIPQGKGSRLLPQVYLSKSIEFRWPDIHLEPISTEGTCYGLRQQVGILVNGDVVPCCLDGEGTITLGNIFERDFEAIVTSERAKVMVKGFEQRKIVEPLCIRCGYRERFS